jgi:hypothetical protein
VTTAGVGEQLVNEITVLIALPEMMVGIDDRQLRLDDLFLQLRGPGRILIITRVGLRIDRPADAPARVVLRERTATGQRGPA